MTIYDQIRSAVDGIADRPAYQIEGRVVQEPFGLEYPHPIYDASPLLPATMLSRFGITHEDFRLILVGMFFLIALALVTRK